MSSMSTLDPRSRPAKSSHGSKYGLTIVLITISIILSVLVLIAITRSSQTSCERFNMSQVQRGHVSHIKYRPLSCSLTSLGGN